MGEWIELWLQALAAAVVVFILIALVAGVIFGLGLASILGG